MSVEVVTESEVAVEESTPGVARGTVFHTDDNVMVRSRVAPGTTSGWHHHGDRHTYGYVVEGAGAVELDTGQRLEGGAGDFFSIPPGTVHRDVNSTDEDVVVLACFVGSGPVVVNVDGPGIE